MRWTKVLDKWWSLVAIIIFFLTPLFHIYLEKCLVHFTFKMDIVKEKGFEPIMDGLVLRGIGHFYIFNSAFFYSLTLGLLLGTLIWVIWIVVKGVKDKKLLLWLTSLILLLPLPLLHLSGKLKESPDFFRVAREKFLFPSFLGREITNWYYLYSPLAAEGIKDFWEKEIKVVGVSGNAPQEFMQWAKREGILVVIGRRKGIDAFFKFPLSKEERKAFLRIPFYLKILRTLLSLSLFLFFPLYFVLLVVSILSFPIRYWGRKRLKFYLTFFLNLLLLILFLPLKSAPSLPSSPEELMAKALGERVFLSLKAIEKLSSLEGSTSYLKEYLRMEMRWFPRLVVWKELKKRGWDGKRVSVGI